MPRCRLPRSLGCFTNVLPSNL